MEIENILVILICLTAGFLMEYYYTKILIYTSVFVILDTESPSLRI